MATLYVKRGFYAASPSYEAPDVIPPLAQLATDENILVCVVLGATILATLNNFCSQVALSHTIGKVLGTIRTESKPLETNRKHSKNQ